MNNVFLKLELIERTRAMKDATVGGPTFFSTGGSADYACTTENISFIASGNGEPIQIFSRYFIDVGERLHYWCWQTFDMSSSSFFLLLNLEAVARESSGER